jgi:5S rRNA maturation endonuclease (ribonuclease M5)
VFPEAWLKTFKIATHFPEAMAYLISRGIDYKMVMELDIRYDPTQHRVCFPFRNYKGELMGLQGRDINKVTSLRYFQYPYHQKHNLHVWMGESTLDLDQPVVLTEGPHDFARIYKHYKNVACSFTSGLSVEKIKRIADATSIITLYDFGAGGNAARAKLKKVLPNVPMEHIVPTEEQDDAGNMTSAELRDALGPFVELLPEDYWLDK